MTTPAATPIELDLDELRGRVGQLLGHSRWQLVTQERVDAFADATGDHQWIHVDPERAATGPFGGTIAHGYFTLSLNSEAIFDVLRIHGAAVVVNYGLNRVRFPAPVPVGSLIRAGITLTAMQDLANCVQATMTIAWEVEDGDRPACVAELVFRYYM